MEIPNSFARTLAKLEGRVKKLNMALHNTRHLYELGDQEMTYAVAMRLADTAEQVTLLARALPACTGNPIAAQELQDVMAINVPVEMGFTKEGWFSVRLPLLLPKKEHASADYIRSILYPAMQKFFQSRPPVRYQDCTLIYRHVYITFTIHTDAEYLRAALEDSGLIAGDESEFGMYVKTVNGMSADYEADGYYWSLYVDGEYATTGVDTTPVADGGSYAFVREAA